MPRTPTRRVADARRARDSRDPCDSRALASLAAGVALTLGATAIAQPSLAGPRLFPRAARIVGVHDTRLDPGTRAYLFTLRDLSGTVIVEYRVPLSHPHVQNGLLRIEETTTGVVPIAAGGLSYRTADPGPSGVGRWILPFDLVFSAAHDANHTATLLSHSLNTASGTVTLRYADVYQSPAGPVRSEKTFALRLIGGSLQIRATSDTALRNAATYDYAGFTFGAGEALPAPAQILHVPYMDMVPVFVGNGGPYVARFVDWYVSGASDTPTTRPALVAGAAGTSGFVGETATGYYKNDRGERNAPLDETAFVTVSRDVTACFPIVDRPPSEYRRLLAQRAVSQNAPGNRYDKARDWVVRAASLGLDDMAHIKWDWTQWPFNLNDPDRFPPPPAAPVGTLWGSVREWTEYANAAANANWSLAPYLSLDMMDPGYPNLVLQLPGSVVGSVLLTPNALHDPTRLVRDAAGQPKKGWDTSANLAGTNLAGSGHPTDVLGPQFYAADMAQVGARLTGADGFPVAGMHIDAQTDVPAWNQIDQRAASGFPRTIAATLYARELAFLAGKDCATGPLFGENSHWRYRAFESQAAGLLDGTSRKIPVSWSPADGPPNVPAWDQPVIVDYELTEVLPKATGFFGMGWESHFAGSGYPVPESFMDPWHTTALSFGHAAFFGTNGDVTNNYWDWRGTLRSYFLMRGVAERLRVAAGVGGIEVRYVDGLGNELALGDAVQQGLDLRHPRLVLRTLAGLELKANHSPTAWTTTVLGQAFTIPTDGFAAVASDGLIAFSAINPEGASRVDYARVPGHYEFVDRRGIVQSFRGFPDALLPPPIGIDPRNVAVVRDDRRNQAYFATGFTTAIAALGPAPAPASLAIAIDDTDTMSLGRLRIGARAVLTDSAGQQRDVTGLVKWTSGDPAVIGVNRSGALAARRVGTAQIQASLARFGLSASRTFRVDPNPVLGILEERSIVRGAALFEFTTDGHCPVAGVLAVDTVTGFLSVAFARSDPAGKHHQCHLTGLVSGRTYRVAAAAINDYGFGTLGSPRLVAVP